MSMVPIFVYGTLLWGEPAHQLLAHAAVRHVPACLPNAQLHSTGPYPIAIQLPPTDLPAPATVYGEVHWLAAGACPALLAHLDQYEGDEYVRARCTVSLCDGSDQGDKPSTVAAWVYLGDPDYAAQFPIIASGDWRKRARDVNG